MKFTEEKLERAFVELLGNENYPHFHGDSIARTTDEVLIEADLLTDLLTKYESQKLTVTEAKSIVLQLKTLPSSDLYESNKTIMRWLSDGFILKREDRNQKTEMKRRGILFESTLLCFDKSDLTVRLGLKWRSISDTEQKEW